MTMDIEKTAKGFTEGSSEQKTHLISSAVGGIIGGYLGGYPGFQIGMALAGYLFAPDPPAGKEYINDDYKTFRTVIDPVPDVIGSDIVSAKCIYINKNTLGTYDSGQLPDMGDSVNEAAWETFIDQLGSSNIGMWAEFAVNFTGRYIDYNNLYKDYHIGVVHFNKKPIWFWTILSDIFENYDNPVDPYDAMTMFDASQGKWVQSYPIENFVDANFDKNTIAYFKGFFADFSALNTDPQSSTINFELENLAEMNPGDFSFGPINTFPLITAEMNRQQVRMPPESMQGGHGLIVSKVLPKPESPYQYVVTCSTVFNNKLGNNKWMAGLNAYTSVNRCPIYYEGMEQFPRYPSNDGDIEYDAFPAWATANLTLKGTYLFATDIFDDRTYVLSYRNWTNPNQGAGVYGVDKTDHHHADYGIKFDIYYHDNTSETAHVTSLLYNYECNAMQSGDVNPAIFIKSMEVDDTYIYLFANVVQHDCVVSDLREITAGANSYTRCYADFSQYPNGYWDGAYAALQQDSYYKYCKINNQTSTYIDVEDEQGGLTGGWGKVPSEGSVVKLSLHPATDCGFAIAGEGSTRDVIICNPPDPTDMCSPAATEWLKCGFAGEQQDCSYSGPTDTTISMSSSLSRDPVPGEIIYFTYPDETYDEDIIDPILTQFNDFLLEVGAEVNARMTIFESNEFQISHDIVIRLNKNTGGSVTTFKSDRVLTHSYGWWWWTASDIVYRICSTDKQIFVWGNQALYGTQFAAHSYLIDITSKSVIEEVDAVMNQNAASHTPTWCYVGTVPVKEWTGSQYENVWYALLRVFDNNTTTINSPAVWGTYFLRLTQGKFSNERVLSSNIPILYGADIDRVGIQKIAFRKGISTGPLYQVDMYTVNKWGDNIYEIGKFPMTEEIYFYAKKWSGMHGAGGHNEFWKYIPPNESNPSGMLYMINKSDVHFDGQGFRLVEGSTADSFQQCVYGFFGNSNGRWYQCDENPANIMELFWNSYIDPRYFPSDFENLLYVYEAEGICNELIPATIYRPQGDLDIVEPRFQFSQTYDQARKIEDVINEVLATCQGFISPCEWSDANNRPFKLVIPNVDEVPVHYFGKDEANFAVSQDPDASDIIYADFSAYPDNYWRGDEIDFGKVLDFQYPWPDSRYGVVIEQTSTYITLGMKLNSGLTQGESFSIKKDNIKEGSFAFAEKSEIDRPNKVRVQFKNRLVGYIKDIAEAEDTYRLDVLGEIEKIATYNMPGIKRATQAGRMAQRILDQINYQKYTCSFETDIMGTTICMGEIIGVSHEITGWSNRWFRIISMDEMMDFEVKMELEEFNPYCYHDSGIPVMTSYPRSGFPAPYIPNNVERFSVKEDIETGALHFLFKAPANDAGFFVGARIYQKVGTDFQYFGIVNQTVSSVLLAQDVGVDDKIIYYDPDTIDGSFPTEGILWIDDELVYYHGLDTTNYAFMNVVRGYKDTDIVEHSIDPTTYLYLRSDSTISYSITDSSLIGTTITFRANSFTVQGLTSDFNIGEETDIDFVGYGLLPYFPESIHKPISEIPETQYLFEALGLSGTLDEIERITEALGLGDDLDYIDIVQIIESLGLGDTDTIAEMLIALTESLGLGDDTQALATEYITETLGLGDTDTIAEMLIAISESLGLGDDLDYVAGETFDFETDFSEYSTGSPPSDWTEHFHTTAFDLDIVTSPADTGGKSLEFDMTTLSQRAAASWDDVGLQYNGEILCKVRWPTSAAYLIGPAMRIGGSDTDESCYFVFTDDTNNRIILYKFKNASGTSLDTYSITLAIDTWYWIRMRVEEDNIKIRIWADGGSEPGSWHIDYTETGTNQIFSMGKIGLFNFNDDGYCDEFKVTLIDEQFDYITDFEEYTLSSPPGDWTEQWNTGNFSLDITTSGSLSKNIMQLDMTSASMMAATWDDIPDCNDVDILTCITTIADGANNIGPVARLSGSAASENGYIVWTNFTSDQITLSRYNAGSGATLDTYSITLDTSTWYWIRMRVVGANIRVKVWSGSRSDEPGSWHIDYDDSSPILSAGKVGLAEYSQDGYVHLFAANVLDYSLLLESGDSLLLESGDKLLLE